MIHDKMSTTTLNDPWIGNTITTTITSNRCSSNKKDMTTQIPLTQPSQFEMQSSQDDQDVDENYTAATGDFNARLKHWLSVIPNMYPVQLAIVFKAGITTNMNLLSKEPKKLKEMKPPAHHAHKTH